MTQKPKIFKTEAGCRAGVKRAGLSQLTFELWPYNGGWTASFFAALPEDVTELQSRGWMATLDPDRAAQ